MALKDWKMTENYKDSISFENKKTEEYIDIYESVRSDENKWRIDLPNDISKTASNKSHAIKFAKQYMRKY